MDVQERLDELNVLVEDAKSMPLSASCVVNRSQVLDLIEEIRQMLPESVHRADELLVRTEAPACTGHTGSSAALANAISVVRQADTYQQLGYSLAHADRVLASRRAVRHR